MTTRLFIYVICLCFIIVSCKREKVGHPIQDADTHEKQFEEYGNLRPGNCNSEIKIWKIGSQPIKNKLEIIRQTSGIIKIQGLIMDKIEANSGVALYLDVSGHRYKAVTGIATSNIPKYPKAQYGFEIPVENLEVGKQAVTFYHIKNEAKAYCLIKDELTLDVR